jgi:hypothetical protein
LDGVEVPVDHEVQQAIDEGADPVLGQVGVVVPPREHSVDRELVVLPDSDKSGSGHERCDRAGDQFAVFTCQVHRVEGEKVMAAKAVELRSLASTGGVLDGE